MKWVPYSVLEELNRIKKDKQLNNQRADHKAFDYMVNYNRAGRQLEHMMGAFGMPLFRKKKGKDRDLI